MCWNIDVPCHSWCFYRKPWSKKLIRITMCVSRRGLHVLLSSGFRWSCGTGSVCYRNKMSILWLTFGCSFSCSKKLHTRSCNLSTSTQNAVNPAEGNWLLAPFQHTGQQVMWAERPTAEGSIWSGSERRALRSWWRRWAHSPTEGPSLLLLHWINHPTLRCANVNRCSICLCSVGLCRVIIWQKSSIIENNLTAWCSSTLALCTVRS